jgi:hypothetical protein
MIISMIIRMIISMIIRMIISMIIRMNLYSIPWIYPRNGKEKSLK